MVLEDGRVSWSTCFGKVATQALGRVAFVMHIIMRISRGSVPGKAHGLVLLFTWCEAGRKPKGCGVFYRTCGGWDRHGCWMRMRMEVLCSQELPPPFSHAESKNDQSSFLMQEKPLRY